MEENQSIVRGLINCDYLVSVNRRLSKRRGSSELRLTDECKREHAQLYDSLKASNIEEGFLSNDKSLYSALLIFYFNRNFLKRDSDNVVKIVVDSISRYVGINDNRIISYKLSKRIIKKFPEGVEPKEYVYFDIERLAKNAEDYEIDYEDFVDWKDKVKI